MNQNNEHLTLVDVDFDDLVIDTSNSKDFTWQEEFIINIVNKKSEDELKTLTQNVLTIKENHFIKDNDIIKFLRELVK